ncbi:hypothetical protein GV827_05895 [Sulfitobacter sp. JBTF-M27]|uniref:Uncharacterized protein n=1 Tax=Sulfitobacter sediminilitoris TaxID=2698830 RepID=A0A6P0C6X9_9RHOB|nr:hypothetical protein [Sulfitobacter sediminilitoris]NEK21931.1 hypothetical protein [Sulfitobacter sediminilitoris]
MDRSVLRDFKGLTAHCLRHTMKAQPLDPTNGEFLMQVVGVLDDPFSV